MNYGQIMTDYVLHWAVYLVLLYDLASFKNFFLYRRYILRGSVDEKSFLIEFKYNFNVVVTKCTFFDNLNLKKFLFYIYNIFLTFFFIIFFIMHLI